MLLRSKMKSNVSKSPENIFLGNMNFILNTFFKIGHLNNYEFHRNSFLPFPQVSREI